MNIVVNGLLMHVETAGDGPPLAALHGFTGASAAWEPFLSDWSRRFRVIAPDLIGHGQSGAPRNADRYSMERFTDDFARLLDVLGEDRICLLGYSMGGRAALAFACRYPEKVHALLLESSSPGLKTTAERKERKAKDHALADKIIAEGVESFVQAWEALPLFASQSEMQRSALRKQRLSNNEIGLANSLRGMGTGAQRSYWDELERLSFPVRLIVGEKDRKFAGIAEEMAQRLPNASVVQVENAGHAVHVEQPRIFDKMVVEFFNHS
ncbi:MAG TPA: 2-succinyl-6-hydroxy-2,4-cyclohexadiene-1-carboxylate synthase [Bacillales bacterium]|nr:2-succinyl-6-hydroxy-2,4-cyclohexadiene-1-carboxylate synthase [Bacillales bacterium]